LQLSVILLQLELLLLHPLPQPHDAQALHLYVSIRQHTSAYVSIRQHTSAYVLHPLPQPRDAQALHLCGDVCSGARPLQLLQLLQQLQHLCGDVCSGARPLDIW
jgi:hypothetical protein